MHPAKLSDEELLTNCELRTDRRSGPGGQHRNKVETAVILVHTPTGIKSEANERRSQADNKRNAVSRLRLSLALQCREDVSLDTQPSELWCVRSRAGRIHVSVDHADFPAILAELLDFLVGFDLDLSLAAKHLNVTASQVVKLLRSYPPALTVVNALRIQRGLHKLT